MSSQAVAMESVRCTNPLAPAWMRGAWPADPDHKQKYAEYPITVSLAAGETSLDNVIKVDGDSCFVWRLTGVNVTGDGIAYMRLRDHRGKYMSNCPVRCASFGRGFNSSPFASAFEVPPGAEILVDLYENGGADTARVNIVLRGFKRYRGK